MSFNFSQQFMLLTLTVLKKNILKAYKKIPLEGIKLNRLKQNYYNKDK